MRQHKRSSPLVGDLALRETHSQFDPVRQVSVLLVVISSDYHIVPHSAASHGRVEVHFRAKKHGARWTRTALCLVNGRALCQLGIPSAYQTTGGEGPGGYSFVIVSSRFSSTRATIV